MAGSFTRRAFTAVLFGTLAVSGCLDRATDPSGSSDGQFPTKVASPSASDVPTTGNGSLSGPHYSLNLIGVSKKKLPDMTKDNGHRIFVALDDSTQILLSPGEFEVLDANGTDGTAAFQLPAPDADNDGVTQYSVYARALGKPDNDGSISTCATDTLTGQVVCSIFPRLFVRSTGTSTFSNVSKELLYVFADLDGDGSSERMPLFDDRLEGYFWEFDNRGLKLVQLRFYMEPTDVN